MDLKTPVATCCGRAITQEELLQIKETVTLFGNLSRKELTHTICEHLDWRTPSGTNKWDACLKMLIGFEKQGHLTLPAKKEQPRRQKAELAFTAATTPRKPVTGNLSALGTILLDRAESPAGIKLWNEYTARYHYLGYKKPFGYHIRYFIRSRDNLLGCMLFSGAAKAISARDQWIGWTPSQRIARLPWIINNSRFLIFPWVAVKNLASHILGKAARCIARDWQEKWGYAPVLMETFVDPERYCGTSYLAANWTYLGLTTGKGLVRKGKHYQTSPKKILAYPIEKNFRTTLCLPIEETAEHNNDSSRLLSFDSIYKATEPREEKQCKKQSAG